ncbi:MAG: putative selenium-dependent hydroxylase accessory protein YqeC [Chloroflexota bacterium]|nr:putative selenium-dependent hydroxylase accessory protein YqeC [Chloroflexota bacterium]MDE3100983.1 putative selenium-dependent hydroxylase accessory protein YqeC [Chloroflexota bacterium]
MIRGLSQRGNALADALALREHDVVAFVGAGGKTTAMLRLARELRARGKAVAVTTTTRIFAPEERGALLDVVGRTTRELRRGVLSALARGDVPVVGRALDPDGKLIGVVPASVAWLAKLPAIDHVLVEADGARGKPFKAPRRGEPVIPAVATLVVIVVGIDAVGRRLRAAAHHAAPVRRIVDVGEDDHLVASTIARVLLHPSGGARGVPRGARVVYLINKADTALRIARARALSRELRLGGARHVVTVALRRRDAVVRVDREPRVRRSRSE